MLQIVLRCYHIILIIVRVHSSWVARNNHSVDSETTREKKKENILHKKIYVKRLSLIVIILRSYVPKIS